MRPVDCFRRYLYYTELCDASMRSYKHLSAQLCVAEAVCCRRQNEDLLLILEQEQRNETEREMRLAQIRTADERQKMDHMFGIERARASERIMNITAEHEAVLANHMSELGLLDRPGY